MQKVFLRAEFTFDIQENSKTKVTQYLVVWRTLSIEFKKKYVVFILQWQESSFEQKEPSSYTQITEPIETNCLPTINNAMNFLTPHL